MRKMAGILIVLAVAIGCGEEEGPQFIEPPLDNSSLTPRQPGETPPADEFSAGIRTHTAASRGDFTLPNFPVSQACSILDGDVNTPVFSSYWNSCYISPFNVVESTVEGILRDLGVFWASSFVPCDCSEIQPPPPYCPSNAYAVRAAPGFIWYDDYLLHLLSEENSLIPVAYVMAHEAAHHVQWRHNYRFTHNKQAELSADCMAGYFMGYLACTGQVDGVDVESSLNAICSVGDLPGTPWWDENAHGSCGERVGVTMIGVSGYALRTPPKDWCSQWDG